MEIIDMTLVQIQQLCAKDQQFRLAFEAWWAAFKRRHNVLSIHH